MKSLKKMFVAYLFISVGLVFSAQEIDYAMLEKQIQSEINQLIQSTDAQFQQLSEEVINLFYIPPTEVLKKKVANVPDYLNHRYVDLAGGKYVIGNTIHPKPGIYNTAFIFFDIKSDQIVKDAITAFENLPTIKIFLNLDNETITDVILSARKDFLSTLLDIKENIYINLLNAKDYLLQDLDSYIRSLITNYQAQQVVILGAPVVYSEPMAEKTLSAQIKSFTSGWWSAFKKEAFTSHIDPETGKCSTAKNVLAEKGEENLFNITPLSKTATKSTVCRSVVDQLNITGATITKNITTKVIAGAKDVASGAQEAAIQAIGELPGKVVEKTKEVAGQIKEKVTAPTEKPKNDPDAQKKPAVKTTEEAQASQDAITVNMNLLQEIMESEPDLNNIQAFINNGAGVNLKDAKGDPILVYAAQEFKLPVIELLLKNKADINAKNDQGENALNALARSYLNQFQRSDPLKELTLNIVDTLVQAKIDIDNQRKDGSTALMVFAAANAEMAIKKLLQSGANPDLKNSQGKKALDLVKKSSVAEQYLIIGRDIK